MFGINFKTLILTFQNYDIPAKGKARNQGVGYVELLGMWILKRVLQGLGQLGVGLCGLDLCGDDDDLFKAFVDVGIFNFEEKKHTSHTRQFCG